MHMADALVSPAVGGSMWVISAGLIGYSAKKVREELDDRKVPLMGVTAAFIFAAQMINFTIPGTGSSGHLGGGLILAVLLGPYAAFLTMASVLTVQALFFADGGLLALGCNIFNLGFSPCFIAYPLIFKKIAGVSPSTWRMSVGSVIAAVVGLQLGALGVVLQTFFSGLTELPLNTFLLLMQPIHLGIGVVEGLATGAIGLFIWRARPEVIQAAASATPLGAISLKKVLVGLLIATVLTGGVFSWFASTQPDGLEWAMFNTSGKEELEAPEHGIHESLAGLQESTALLPDYGFPANGEEGSGEGGEEAWPAVNPGTSVSGLVGGGLTLLLVVLMGIALKRRRVAKKSQ